MEDPTRLGPIAESVAKIGDTQLANKAYDNLAAGPMRNENSPVPESDGKSAMASKELIRVLEAAALAGVESVGLEWKGDDLLVFHETENRGYVATKISTPLTLEVIAEIVKRAQIGRKRKGNMRLRLLGQEYSVAAEEYDSFGESAFTLKLKKRGKKRAE
jgi:hypothetical protein